jgi:hypothetical protein
VFREKSSAQGYNPYRNRAEIYPAQDKVWQCAVKLQEWRGFNEDHRVPW